jgi:hypothetical protein
MLASDTTRSFIYAAATHNTTKTKLYNTLNANNNRQSCNLNSVLLRNRRKHKIDNSDYRRTWKEEERNEEIVKPQDHQH